MELFLFIILDTVNRHRCKKINQNAHKIFGKYFLYLHFLKKVNDRSPCFYRGIPEKYTIWGSLCLPYIDTLILKLTSENERTPELFSDQGSTSSETRNLLRLIRFYGNILIVIPTFKRSGTVNFLRT